MTLNHLIASLQSWSNGECGVRLNYHCSQVHFDRVVVPVRVSFMGQIELLVLNSNTSHHLTVCKQ